MYGRLTFLSAALENEMNGGRDVWGFLWQLRERTYFLIEIEEAISGDCRYTFWVERTILSLSQLSNLLFETWSLFSWLYRILPRNLNILVCIDYCKWQRLLNCLHRNLFRNHSTVRALDCLRFWWICVVLLCKLLAYAHLTGSFSLPCGLVWNLFVLTVWFSRYHDEKRMGLDGIICWV